MGTSDEEEWEVREDRTNRLLGTYSAATRPARGDVIELNGRPFNVIQVADVVVGNGERRQRGWLIVSTRSPT